MESRRDFLEEHERFLEGVLPHDLQALTSHVLEELVLFEAKKEVEDGEV